MNMINYLLRKIRRNNAVLMVVVLQFCCSFLFAQSGSKVEGKVLDEDAAPLPGVNVLVKGTSVGTTTDSEGAFALSVPDQNAVLVFSFIGYKSHEVTVGSQTRFDVTLASDIETLSEVVVVGYGQTKKESLTGAITAVKGRDLVKSPQSNLSNSFAGRVSGVVANTASG